MRPSLLRWIGCGVINVALVTGFVVYFQIPRNAWLFACLIFSGLWLESVLARSLWDVAEWYAAVATITVVGAITASLAYRHNTFCSQRRPASWPFGLFGQPDWCWQRDWVSEHVQYEVFNPRATGAHGAGFDRA